MKVEKIVNGSELVAKIEGRLDTVTAPELEASLKDDLASIEKLTLDLAGLEYISSAGLRVLLQLHKSLAAKGGMIIKNANEIVSEVFDITGFADILTIE